MSDAEQLQPAEQLLRAEHALQRAIIDPAPSAAVLAEPLVRASARMTQAERLAVYRHAYVARLQECLADDFPMLQRALGEQHFAALCRDYIARNPPRSPSLNAYGSGLPAHCAQGSAVEPALAELARLEWALVELVHAPQVPAITAEALQARAQDFSTARLQPVPALQLLHLRFPVVALHAALRAQQPAALPAPGELYALVHRVAWEVRCVSLDPRAGALLQQLIGGEPIGQALDLAADAGACEQDVMAWFQDWLGKGLFAGVQ